MSKIATIGLAALFFLAAISFSINAQVGGNTGGYNLSNSNYFPAGSALGNINMGGYDITGINELRSLTNFYVEVLTRTSNATPYNLYLNGGNAYPQAGGAAAIGGSASLAGGIGGLQIIIDNYANCAGDNVHVIIDGTDNTLTEGAEWTAATSNTVTAASLAAAVEALTGTSGTSSTAYVLVWPDYGVGTIDLTESDGTCTSLVEGAHGHIKTYGDIRLHSTSGVDYTNLSYISDGVARFSNDAGTSGLQLGVADASSTAFFAKYDGTALSYVNFGPTGAAQIAIVNAATPTITFGKAGGGVATLSQGGLITTSGTITCTNASSIGWSKVAGADTACNTTCTSACVFGQNTADMSIVACDDATADVCICAGAS